MTSSARWSPEHGPVATTTTNQRRGRRIALALACLLAIGAARGTGAQDAPAADAASEGPTVETPVAESPAPSQPEVEQPVLEAAIANGGALDECAADDVAGEPMADCLEAMEARVAAALEAVLATATAYFAELDTITGNQRASLTLGQGQAAFALYRDLDCHLAELAQGVSTTAADHGRACRIDHDRARIAKLAALLPPGSPSAAAASPGDPAMILGTAWRAADIDGTPVAAEVEITLAIDEAAAVSGVGGCNRYFGTAEITGERIDMGALGATRMACPEPAMEEERRYFEALESVTAWQLDGETLLLSDAAGTVRLRFEPDAG